MMTITHTALSPDLTDQHLAGWLLIAEQFAGALPHRHRPLKTGE